MNGAYDGAKTRYGQNELKRGAVAALGLSEGQSVPPLQPEVSGVRVVAVDENKGRGLVAMQVR